jgi:iron complex outermembrane recepter protein
VTGTIAWFDLQRTNVAITDSLGKSYQTGKQRSTGIDLDLQWRASNALTLLAAMTVQSAKIVEDSFNATLVDKQLFNVPERSARLAARYNASGSLAGWGAGLGVTYRDVLPGDSKNTFFTPAATVWDTQLSYQGHKARYGIGINNLLDAKYYVPSAYFGGGNVTPAAPRTLLVTADFSF